MTVGLDISFHHPSTFLLRHEKLIYKVKITLDGLEHKHKDVFLKSLEREVESVIRVLMLQKLAVPIKIKTTNYNIECFASTWNAAKYLAFSQDGDKLQAHSDMFTLNVKPRRPLAELCTLQTGTDITVLSTEVDDKDLVEDCIREDPSVDKATASTKPIQIYKPCVKRRKPSHTFIPKTKHADVNQARRGSNSAEETTYDQIMNEPVHNANSMNTGHDINHSSKAQRNMNPHVCLGPKLSVQDLNMKQKMQVTAIQRRQPLERNINNCNSNNAQISLVQDLTKGLVRDLRKRSHSKNESHEAQEAVEQIDFLKSPMPKKSKLNKRKQKTPESKSKKQAGKTTKPSCSAPVSSQAPRRIYWSQRVQTRSTDKEALSYLRDKTLIQQEEIAEEMKLQKLARPEEKGTSQNTQPNNNEVVEKNPSQRCPVKRRRHKRRDSIFKKLVNFFRWQK